MQTPNIQNVLKMMKKNLFYSMILVSFISCETSEKNSNEKENNKSSVEQNESEKNSNDEEILRNYKRAKELEKQEVQERICLGNLDGYVNNTLGQRRTVNGFSTPPTFEENVKVFGLSQEFDEFMLIYRNSSINFSEKMNKWNTFMSKYDKKFYEWSSSFPPTQTSKKSYSPPSTKPSNAPLPEPVKSRNKQ